MNSDWLDQNVIDLLSEKIKGDDSSVFDVIADVVKTLQRSSDLLNYNVANVLLEKIN